MKIELVDVCGQTDTINKEVEQLKQKGFFITGQHGGGEYGSCLVMKKAIQKMRSNKLRKNLKNMKSMLNHIGIGTIKFIND